MDIRQSLMFDIHGTVMLKSRGSISNELIDRDIVILWPDGFASGKKGIKLSLPGLFDAML